MRKKFFVNLGLVLLLNVLIKPFWVLGIDRTVQNIVGAESYGLYFSLFNFSLILNILLDLGLTNYNNRNIAQHNQLLSKFFGNIVVLKFILGIFYAVFCIILGIIFGYTWQQFNLLFFLIINQFILSFILYLRSNISGLYLFKTDSLISVLDRFLMILICSILLWSNITESKFKIEWLVYSQTASYTITALVAFFVVLSKTKFIKIKIDLPFLITILKNTYPYALLVFLMGFYNRFDGFIIERLLPDGKAQSGIYAQAFRLLDAVSQFALLFAVLLLPIFSKMIKERDSIKQLLQFSFLLLITPSLIAVITSVVFSTEIMNLLYENHVESSSVIFAILIISFLPISVTYIFGTLLTANGNLRQLNIMAFAGVLINLILNLVLISNFKATGAAIAALITQSFTALAQVLISKKVFKFRIKIKHLLILLSYTLIFFGITYLLKILIDNWYLSFTISIVIGFILGFTFKLLNLKTFYQVLKSQEKF